MNLPENLRRFRLDAGLTQAVLAEQLGVSDRAVSRWERGISSPDVTLLPRLALVLGTSVDALLGVDPQRMHTAILRVTEECTRLLNAGDIPAAVQLLREQTVLYPGQPELMVYLARALLALKTAASAQEALALCHASQARIDAGAAARLSTRFGCRQIMVLALKRLGKSEQAAHLAEEELPAIWVCRELMLARVAPPDRAMQIRKSNVQLLSGLLADTLDRLGHTTDARSIRQICEVRPD